jgi:hypothetical protein
MDDEDAGRVVVVDVKIRFWSMVVLLVKWAIAAIPAMIILFALAAALMALLGLFHIDWNWWSAGRGTV